LKRHVFLTSALDGGEWSALCCSIPGRMAAVNLLAVETKILNLCFFKAFPTQLLITGIVLVIMMISVI
jgi:hypothetical protein